VFFIYFFFFLKQICSFEKKRKSEGHQSPLNKVFGSPSFGFEKRPVKEQELHYVINIFWRFKGGFAPWMQAGRALTTLFQGFFGKLAVFYRAVSCSPPYYSRDEMMVTGIPSSINSTCHGYFHIH